ncbi:MAG: hypothetical protein GYA81_07130 [Chloroflexi bacterium]|nr:hypothetical protein [Chloroflexota bacterium]
MRKFCCTVFVLFALLSLSQPAAAKPSQVETMETEVWIVSTLHVAPYTPFETMSTHVHEAYTGSLGTHFHYVLSSMYGPYLQNLSYLGSPGTVCTWDVDLLRLDCSCSTGITAVDIDFTLVLPADDYYGGEIWLGWAGNYNGYPIDYTIVLNYPAPLVYVDYYGEDAPTSVNPTNITWHKVSATDEILLVGYAAFLDPRVFPVFLPIVVR